MSLSAESHSAESPSAESPSDDSHSASSSSASGSGADSPNADSPSADFILADPGQQSFLPRPFGGSAQVVLNTTSFDDILAQLQNVAGALEAEKNEMEPQSIALIPSGCFTNSTGEMMSNGTGVRAGDGFRDCPAACSNPASMFNSSFTFWNCLTLGATGWYIADLDLNVNQTSLSQVGETLGFQTLNQFNVTQILSDTLSCIKGSCQDYSLGSCSTNITTLDISGSQNQVQALFEGLKDYCAGMDTAVNTDIAGPGVVLSYILQAALAIAVYVFINLFTTWLRPLLSFLYTVQDRMLPRAQRDAAPPSLAGAPRPPPRTPWQRAGEHQRAVARSRPAAALTYALVEFQEVQGFFVASIQLATLVIFASADPAAMLSSTNSFAEAVMNVEIVQMLSVNGMLPVLFTQIGLMRLGVRWWYLTAIVVVVFSLAITISQKSLMPDYETLWSYFKAESPIDTCGGNPSPMTYCLDELGGIDQRLKSMNSGLIVGCLAVPALIVDQLWHAMDHKRALSDALDSWELSSPRVAFLRHRLWPVSWAVAWFCLEFTLLIYVGMYLKAVIDILQFVGTSSSNWTFGQLVAIMVWAPVIGKYLYFNVFGITEGVGKRLASRYKIVEVDEDDDDDDPDRKAFSPKDEDAIELRPRKDVFGTPDNQSKETFQTLSPKTTFQTLSRKTTFPTLSREDTLVASLTPGTPRTPYADSPFEDDFARKNNPFDDFGRGGHGV